MLSCPVVIHPDNTASPAPRPKSVVARSKRSRHADDGGSSATSRQSCHSLPEWRVGFEQQSRNLQHHIHQSKTEAAASHSWHDLSDLREDTLTSEQRSVGTFVSDGAFIAESVATAVQREFSIMRDWVMEKNEDQKIWFESALSEMKALQLRVLDGLQDFRVTINTNQETQLTPILRGTANSKPAPVAGQCMSNVQASSEQDGEAGTASMLSMPVVDSTSLATDRAVGKAHFHSMPSIPIVDSASSAADPLHKDKTRAFNRICNMVTSDIRNKKGSAYVQHVLGLTPEDITRIREAHAQNYAVSKAMSYLTPTEPTKLRFGQIPDEPPQRCLAAFVQGGLFTGTVSLVVILNSIFVGMDVNDDMRRAVHNEGEQDPFFETTSICCTIFFTIELILRMIGLRLWFIFGDDKCWNLFDTVLVAFSLIDLIVGERSGNWLFLRILKIFRLARILRVIRLLQFFKELGRMVLSILASLRAFAWALLLILLMMYVCSVLLMRAGADYLSESGTSADRRLWQQFYGSITTSMYMLLQCVSGGQDWGQMVEPLERLSVVYKILYVFFIIFLVFGLLNVLTGVFIGTAGEVLDRDFITQAEIFKERRFVSDMKRLVRKLRDDKKSEITWSQFCKLTEKPEMQAFLAANGLSASDGHLLYGLCAGSMDATQLCTEDFAVGCHRLKGPANQLQVEALMIELELVHSLMHVNFTKVLKYLCAAEYANGKILTPSAPAKTTM